jgi:hypothetical protein
LADRRDKRQKEEKKDGHTGKRKQKNEKKRRRTRRKQRRRMAIHKHILDRQETTVLESHKERLVDLFRNTLLTTCLQLSFVHLPGALTFDTTSQSFAFFDG